MNEIGTSIFQYTGYALSIFDTFGGLWNQKRSPFQNSLFFDSFLLFGKKRKKIVDRMNRKFNSDHLEV